MTVVELFAGAGGAALGLHRAGMQHVALVERDADACATLRAAGFEHVIEADVRDVRLPRADVLWSSFPCQPWSHAGRRDGAADERNGWPWTVAAVDAVGPAWLLGENVPGLTMHRSGCPAGQLDLMVPPEPPEPCPRCYLDRVILADLRARFACVGWWLLDAADYGVPQHRRRVFLWAGPSELRPPPATHGPGLMPYVTTGQALGLVGTLDGGRNSAANPTQERVRSTDEPAQTVGTRGNMMFEPRIAARQAGNAGPFVVWTGGGYVGEEAERDITHRPCQTLVASRERPSLVDGEHRRRLTVAECAALQGFPAAHPFQGTRTSQHRQVGNAVPPALAEVVAVAVKRARRAGREVGQ